MAASSISTPGAITLELPGSSRWATTTARRDFRASSSRGSRPYGARLPFHDRAQAARAGLAVDGLAGNGAQGRVRPPQDRGFRLLVTGNGIKLSMLPTVRHEDSATSTRKKNNPGKELEASSTWRVRHCWLADIDLAPAFVRHNHPVSWTPGDDTGRLHGPRAHPRGHGGAVNFGPPWNRFSAFYHETRLVELAACSALAGALF